MNPIENTGIFFYSNRYDAQFYILDNRVAETIPGVSVIRRSPTYFRHWPGMIDIVHPYFLI
jgi:hypothetical protein